MNALYHVVGYAELVRGLAALTRTTDASALLF